MKRRTFLAFLGLAPAASALPAVEVARKFYAPTGGYMGYLVEATRTNMVLNSDDFTRATKAWIQCADNIMRQVK